MSGSGEVSVRMYCRECRWHGSVTSSGGLKRALSLAWSSALEHSWTQFGHVVETWVGNRLRSTHSSYRLLRERA